MDGKATGTGRGLLDSLSTLAATLLATAHTRLDLLSTDTEEAVAHLSSQVMLVVTSLFCLGVSIVLAAVLLAVTFWDSHRLLVLGVLAGLFLGAAGVCGGIALLRARARPRLFAASLSELYKDRQHLAARS